jgi:hypothetical protein
MSNLDEFSTLNDTPFRAFSEGILKGTTENLFGIEAMVVDKEALIEQGVEFIREQLDSVLGHEVVIEKINLEKISTTLAENGYVVDGELVWNLSLFSPAFRIARLITVSNPIRNGKLEKVLFMTNSQGVAMPFTREAVKNFITMNITGGRRSYG